MCRSSSSPTEFPGGTHTATRGRSLVSSPRCSTPIGWYDTVGLSRAISSVIYTGSTVVEPGVIESKHAMIKLILGEPDGYVSDRVRAVAGLFETGGLACQATDRIREAVWAKLITNIASGPLCLLSRQNLRCTLADPSVRAAAVRVVEEGMELAAAPSGSNRW
jgi:2-dehydropantoate 2-reductase